MNKKLNNIVMFACNQGGHFSQMMGLKELFGKYESILITDNIRATKDMKALQDINQIEYVMAMAEKRKRMKKSQSSRWHHIKYYLKSFSECYRLWKKYRPAVIISTGSNIAVPLFFIGRLHGSKLIFIETRAKVYSRSLTGMLVRNISNQIYVQWSEMLELYPEAKYCGTLV